MISWAKNIYIAAEQKYPRLAKVGRYLVSGGLAAFTNLFFLYVFTDVVGMWYILSAILAFLIAFVVSFLLQKYWTFQDTQKEGVRAQAAIYLGIAVTNLGLNTLILYGFVEYAGIHYLVAQILASAIIAIESFFVYQKLVFKKP